MLKNLGKNKMFPPPSATMNAKDIPRPLSKKTTDLRVELKDGHCDYLGAIWDIFARQLGPGSRSWRSRSSYFKKSKCQVIWKVIYFVHEITKIFDFSYFGESAKISIFIFMFVSKWADIRVERVDGSNRITEQCSSSLKINGDGVLLKIIEQKQKIQDFKWILLLDSDPGLFDRASDKPMAGSHQYRTQCT